MPRAPSRIVLWLGGWLIVLVGFAGLLSGAAWLDLDLFGSGLPLGTLAAALVFVLLPALALPVLAPGMLRRMAGLLVVLGGLWLPVSAWMAGNLRLSFDGAPDWWWPATIALPACSVLLWIFIFGRAGARRLRHGDRQTG